MDSLRHGYFINLKGSPQPEELGIPVPATGSFLLLNISSPDPVPLIEYFYKILSSESLILFILSVFRLLRLFIF